MKPGAIIILILVNLGFTSCTKPATVDTSKDLPMIEDSLDTIVLGGGCFWCSESVFLQLRGVARVTSGYAGGTKIDPTYEEVTTGTTGHAEVVQVSYDPRILSLADVLEVFFSSHDPTTLNRQGADVGTQYRSVILTSSEEQRSLAEGYIRALDSSGLLQKPVVTVVEPLTVFYPAESYHQDYFNRNRGQAYCQFVIAPKLKTVTEKFRHLLKSP